MITFQSFNFPVLDIILPTSHYERELLNLKNTDLEV